MWAATHPCRTRSRLLQSWSHVNLGGADSRRETEEKNSREYRYACTEGQHGQIKVWSEVEGLSIPHHQNQEPATAPLREKKPEKAPERRKQNALREELPNQTPSGRPKGQADSNFPPARRGAGKQQRGDVSTGNRQDQADHDCQDPKWAKGPPTNQLSPRLAGMHTSCGAPAGLRPVLTAALALSKNGPFAAANASCSLTPGLRRAMIITHHQSGLVQSSRLRCETCPKGRTSSCTNGIQMSGATPGLDSKEFRGRDAYNGEGQVVDEDGLANRQWGAPEPARPIAVTDQRHSWRILFHVGFCYYTAHYREDPQPRKK